MFRMEDIGCRDPDGIDLVTLAYRLNTRKRFCLVLCRERIQCLLTEIGAACEFDTRKFVDMREDLAGCCPKTSDTESKRSDPPPPFWNRRGDNARRSRS